MHREGEDGRLWKKSDHVLLLCVCACSCACARACVRVLTVTTPAVSRYSTLWLFEFRLTAEAVEL